MEIRSITLLCGKIACTTEECDWIRENIGPDKIYQTTGLTIDPYFSGSKILWIKKHYPEIYQNTYKFLYGTILFSINLQENLRPIILTHLARCYLTSII